MDPAILVTASQNGEWYSAHRVDFSTPALTVEVVCWDKDGQWADTNFNIAYLK